MFKRNRPGATAQMRCSIAAGGIVLRMEQDGGIVPRSDWTRLRPEIAEALKSLLVLATNSPEVARASSDCFEIDGPALAMIGPSIAYDLGLPPATRLALDLTPIGGVQETHFRIETRWVRPGGAPERVEVYDGVLKTARGLERIPEPLYSLAKAASELSLPIPDEAQRYQCIAALKERWPEDIDARVQSDAYLEGLRLHYAAGVSIKIDTLTPERTTFEPVLFSARALQSAEEQTLNEEEDSLLSNRAQKVFARERFTRSDGARAAYVIGQSEYVYVDPQLRPILKEMRALQLAPENERREFVLNPAKILRERLGEAASDLTRLESLFVETEQFSARVAGVDVWRMPVLPWLTPVAANKWLPERFGLRVGDEYYSVPRENVGELIDRTKAAQTAAAPTVSVGDLLTATIEGQTPPAELPLTDRTYEAVISLAPFASPHVAEDRAEPTSPTTPVHEEWNSSNGKLFLVVKDNFEDVEFTAGGGDSRGLDAGAPIAPLGLKTTLKPHQRLGIEWLAACVRLGRPGALLADDMGLGKTLQAIAFMAWLRDEAHRQSVERTPFLIVAPTGLLGNWKAEIQKHLDQPQLGELVSAFGGDLKRLREESGLGGRDIETGRASLQSGAWRHAGVVLTTYETLRDYHFSFARTRFATIVFDEIQKLKNPASQMTRAAKSLNAAFVLGMTGTPVENRLQDLWSIMDVIAPGLLGSSRSFEQRHPATDRGALGRLRRQLMEASPGYMLRRMKAEILDGLPQKNVHPMPTLMPPPQALAYKDVVARAYAARAGGEVSRGRMLGLLAEMRGVSLHPRDPASATGDLAAFASESARLSSALKVLEDVRSRREKALIFVEDLAMQDRLADLLQRHFDLPERPMLINGGIAGLKRQVLVERFQCNPGRFDVMILSPKAGGVGLTLTAANHVIHLSRWWNPAVEDQATDRVFRIGQTRDVHVHIPMAIHPEPALTESSFDRLLDTLIERKRGLTRDFFLPPDVSDADLSMLFEGAALSNVAPTSIRVSSPQDSLPASTAAGPLSSAPLALSDRGIRFWKVHSGEPRPTTDIIALFKDLRIARVKISDPYALATQSTREAHVRFLNDLAAVASVSTAIIEYAPDIDAEFDDENARKKFGDAFGRSVAQGKGVHLHLKRREKHRRGHDFHDRYIEIITETQQGQKTHELQIGRGVEALYADHRECSVTYVPPGAANLRQ